MRSPAALARSSGDLENQEKALGHAFSVRGPTVAGSPEGLRASGSCRRSRSEPPPRTATSSACSVAPPPDPDPAFWDTRRLWRRTILGPPSRAHEARCSVMRRVGSGATYQRSWAEGSAISAAVMVGRSRDQPTKALGNAGNSLAEIIHLGGQASLMPCRVPVRPTRSSGRRGRRSTSRGGRRPPRFSGG